MSRATVTEMAIVFHWATAVERSVETAFDLHQRCKSRYPRVELLPKVSSNTLDGELTITADPEPRWVFVSENQAFALQYQDLLLGVNWRKRTPPGQDPVSDYPGFEFMLDIMKSEISDFSSQLTDSNRPQPNVSAARLFYDNMWLLPDDITPISSVFSFWKTLGIEKPVLGPEVKFTTLLDGSAQQPARVDVTCSLGVVVNENVGRRAARIQLNGIAQLSGTDDPMKAVSELHDQISDLYQRVTTEAVRIG